MNVNPYITREYEKFVPLARPKNKPNFKPDLAKMGYHE